MQEDGRGKERWPVMQLRSGNCGETVQFLGFVGLTIGHGGLLEGATEVGGRHASTNKAVAMVRAGPRREWTRQTSRRLAAPGGIAWKLFTQPRLHRLLGAQLLEMPSFHDRYFVHP
jgi:hypothetical protein